MSQIDRDYSEKRDFIRMTIDAKVTLHTDNQPLDAICRDLSSSGMQLETTSALPTDSQIGIRMPSNHESLRDFAAKAQVIWTKDLGAGKYLLGLKIIEME